MELFIGFALKSFKTYPQWYLEPNTTKEVVNGITNIYFIQSEIGGPIKIGKAHDVRSRIEEFQKGCPFELKILHILKNVSSSIEGKLHKKYKNYRIRGEWFAEEILEFLENDLNTMPAKQR